MQGEGTGRGSKNPKVTLRLRYVLMSTIKYLYIFIIDGFPKFYWFGQEHN